MADLDFRPDLSQPMPGADAALASGWTWKNARAACDAHKRGDFAQSWQLTIDAPSSPAIRAAEGQRLAPVCGMPWEVKGPPRAPARIETEAASRLWQMHFRRLLRSIGRDVAYMGLSVLQHPTAVNPTTLRREVLTVERWPLSQVRFTATPFSDPWNPGRWIFGYYALQFGVGDSIGEVMYGGLPLPKGVNVRFIQLPRPGQTDGHWTVIGEGDRPHLNGAIVSLDTPFVAGQLAPRARANLLKQYGRQSPVATAPASVAVGSPEWKAAKEVVNGIGIDREGGLLPNGALLQGFSVATPTASLFLDDAQLTERAVALALLGRAGSLGKEDAQYPSPIEADVPEDLIRADVKTIADGFDALANLIAAQNTAMPSSIELVSNMPDTEQQEQRAADDAHRKAQLEAAGLAAAQVKAERDAGLLVDAARIAAIYKLAGVDAPSLPPGEVTKPADYFAYDLTAGTPQDAPAPADTSAPPPSPVPAS